MASIKYTDIFNLFLGEVTDYKIYGLNVTDAYALMSEYLQKAVSDIYVRKLFSSIVADKETQLLTYEMSYPDPDGEDVDADFIKLLISKAMVMYWLKPQVNSRLNTEQFFGGKEQKFYAQANHTSSVRSLYEDQQLEVKKLIRDRGYLVNSYLENNSNET